MEARKTYLERIGHGTVDQLAHQKREYAALAGHFQRLIAVALDRQKRAKTLEELGWR